MKSRAVCVLSVAALLAGAGCTSDASPERTGGPSAPSTAGGSGVTSGASTPVPSPGSAAPSTGTSTTGPVRSASTTPHGNVNQTVASQSISVAAPIALNRTAQFGGKVSARISDLRRFNATATGPGETSGPALRVTFVFTNGSAKSVDLSAIVADMSDGAGSPGVSLSGPPAAAFSGRVAAGASVSGVYVFRLPRGFRNPVTISLGYTTEAPIVQFRGSV